MDRGRNRNVELAVAVVRDGRAQYVLAAAAGIHANRLNGIIRGRLTANARERQRIAAVLNLDEDALFVSEARSVA